MISIVKHLRLTQFVVAVSVLLSTGAFVPPLIACATVSSTPITIAAPVFVQAENAVIIWDSQHQMEHFIRQAKISTESPDLGFLVPTPETPEVAEADPKIFDMVSDIGSPTKHAPVFRETPWQVLAPVAVDPTIQTALEGAAAPIFGLPRTSPLPRLTLAPPVAESEVAGYRVTTLDPANTNAVSNWLGRNGYVATPALQAWLHRYAEAGWKINAFRLSKPQTTATSLTTRAIRLSFHTAKPYYPYSEPADRQRASAASPGGRVLHVAVLSNQRMTGAKSDATKWPGQLMYAGSSAPKESPYIASQWLRYAKLDDAGRSISPLTELTTFVDQANPRPGSADLYFSPDADPSIYRATLVDHSLPTVRQLDWGNPIADGAALLAVILIPGVPLYLGWLIYSRNRARLAGDGAWRPTAPATNARQKIMGLLGIIWSLFYGILLMYKVVVWGIGQLGSALTTGNPSSAWQMSLVLDGLGVVAATALIGGVVYCGAQAMRSRPANPAPGTPSQVAMRRKLQETYALAAMFAGGIGLALMLYAVLALAV